MPRKKASPVKKKARHDLTSKAKAVAKRKAAPKKERVPKTRNCNTQTESSFWTMIKQGLRRQSMYWKPISKCKELSRREYAGPNKRQKWEYQCNHCKDWFIDGNIQVDHIIPVGSIKCYDDLPGYVSRLFCEVTGLQVLCSGCHSIKTEDDIKNIRNEKDNRNNP